VIRQLWMWVRRRDDLGDVRDDVLVLRAGRAFEVRVPLRSVVTVRAERKYHSGRTIQRTGTDLSIVIGNQTDVVLTLSESVGTARVVRFRADEPAKAVTAIRAPRGTTSGSPR